MYLVHVSLAAPAVPYDPVDPVGIRGAVLRTVPAAAHVTARLDREPPSLVVFLVGTDAGQAEAATARGCLRLTMPGEVLDGWSILNSEALVVRQYFDRLLD
ncbi:hypothetical protein ATKI12_5850 [Kitasatospora sp. Ki12]|uniref:hypothetical protein n=1 Tax=Kitasatospora xanthocidica TaxID=83382 RepID=UPI0016776508|nr:hypothetical protein [Kitasatospora xanthocidica]GHF53194.1 hypothetical protein GCM10018790_33690 [Kitasatospora xanthocidica]